MILMKASTDRSPSSGTYQRGTRPVLSRGTCSWVGANRSRITAESFRVRGGYDQEVAPRIRGTATYADPRDQRLTDIFPRGQVRRSHTVDSREEAAGTAKARGSETHNMANSWINAAYRSGASGRIACPGLRGPRTIWWNARENATCHYRDTVKRQGRDSLTRTLGLHGREASRSQRERAFRGFSVIRRSEEGGPRRDLPPMLPAHSGRRSCGGRDDGAEQRVDDAGKPMQIQKAIMAALMGEGEIS